MLSGSQRQAVLARISTNRVLASAVQHAALDRLPGSPGLEQAASRIAARLEQVRGLEARAVSFPTGPERRYFSWVDQRRPFPELAELWLQEPDGGEILLCRRADNFACSMGAYRATEREGEVLDLVDVGFGTRPGDYRGHRMAGKVALASGHYFEAAMIEALASRRAEGLLCGPGGDTFDATRVVPRLLGDPELFGDHRAFGFNLSGRQYNRLAQRLAAGEAVKVRVAIRLAAGLGEAPGVTAALPGSDLDHQRVLLMVHLSRTDGPLAAAVLEELMRTLAALSVEGIIPPLRRRLELVALPDARATVAWMASHDGPEEAGLAALQLGLPSAVSAAKLALERPLAGTASFIGDQVEDHLRWAASVEGSFRTELPVSVRSARSGAANPTRPLHGRPKGIPTLWLRGREPAGAVRDTGAPHGPLHRLTAGLACAALDLCTLGEADLPRLISSGHLRAQGRLARRAWRLRQAARPELEQEERTSAAGRHLMWHADASMKEGLVREQEILESAARFMGSPGRHALRLAEVEESMQQTMSGLLASLQAELATGLETGPATPRRKALTALERRAEAVVPRCSFEGPLPTPHLLREAEGTHRSWLAHNAGALADQPVAEELVQWINGRRTLLEVFDLVRLDHPHADPKLLWRYLEALQSAGWVELEEDRRITEA